MTRGLRAYLTATAFSLVPSGIQMVLFPWLIAVYLQETPERVGVAQMAGQLPMLVLILWGGLIGDRIDQRRLFVILCVLMALPPAIMAGLFSQGFATYEVLLAYAFVIGAFGAFSQPTRDALLNRVAGSDIQRVVTLAIGVQFGVQIIGFSFGSMAERLGAETLMVTQSVVILIAAVATLRIPKLPPMPEVVRRSVWKEIGEGVVLAWRSDVIRPAVILTFGVGVCFAGSYLVLLPLMVRDLYAGGATGMAFAFGANMLGTCTTIMILMRRGGLARPGRALVLGGFASCAALGLLFFELSEWAFYGVIYLWGMCGGVNMTMSRSIVQEASPTSHRARILSVYSLGMMGGMPIGSILLGWSVAYFGARSAVLVPVGIMTLVFAALATQLWRIERDHGGDLSRQAA